MTVEVRGDNTENEVVKRFPYFRRLFVKNSAVALFGVYYLSTNLCIWVLAFRQHAETWALLWLGDITFFNVSFS